MAWLIGSALLLIGLGLLIFAWFLTQIPYVDSILPEAAFGAGFALLGVIVLIVKIVA